MPIISGGHVIEGAYGDPLLFAGTPGAGTSEVNTLTIGGTPTSGTFKLSYDGATTAAITWSATNATLLANINTALDALPTSGTGGIVATDSSLTAGIGALLLTFAANLAKKAVNTVVVANNSLAGSSPTLAIVKTTPGVDADYRGLPKGQLVEDTTNGLLYINTGTPLVPVFTKVGTQT